MTRCRRGGVLGLMMTMTSLVALFILLGASATQAGPVAGCTTAPAANPRVPECPRVLLTTTFALPTGGIKRVVAAGGDLQAALNVANPGDVLELQAGATFTGNFTLPAKPGPGWIYLVSSALAALPEGVRVGPAQASLMPKLVSPNDNPVLTAGAGAQFYRLAGLELTTNGGRGSTQYALVVFAAGSDLVVDRSYVHGSWNQAVRQGIQLNNARTSIIDSYLAEFHISEGDAQAIIGWNGPGPFKIVNNRLEGSAENILFGGADPSVANLVPSDIEIRGNHIVKPLSWWPGSSAYTGMHWTVKNLLELKNAQRVLIEGNVLENCWVDRQAAFGQQGATGFVLTTRNQGGGCPWCVVQDVTITNNIVRNLGQASVFGGGEGAGARRVLARNNLLSVNGQLWGPGGFSGGANGRLFHLGSISAVTIDHNTGFQDGAILWDDGSVDNASVAYTNNLSPIGGAAGTGSGFQGGGIPGTTTKNVFISGSASSFPPGNFFPATVDDVRFLNSAAGDYRLAPTSPYKNAGTDGADVGADLDALALATACAVSGLCAPPPPPPPAPTLPGTLQAAAYTSVTPATVTVYAPSPGVTALNNLTTGAVVTYAVQAAAGSYAVKLLVSNGGWTPPPALHLAVDGVVVSAPILVPSSGGWSIYRWVSAPVPITLAAGAHTLSVVSDQQYFNLQAIQADLILDTTPPTVPTPSQLTVTVTTSDAVGVVGVQFQVDGVNAGPEVTAPPYVLRWVPVPGVHQIQSIARDAAGNTSRSAPLTVTIP